MYLLGYSTKMFYKMPKTGSIRQVSSRLHLNQHLIAGQHPANFHHRADNRIGAKQASYPVVGWVVAQVTKILHQLEDVFHLPALGFHNIFNAVQYKPALRYGWCFKNIDTHLPGDVA